MLVLTGSFTSGENFPAAVSAGGAPGWRSARRSFAPRSSAVPGEVLDSADI